MYLRAQLPKYFRVAAIALLAFTLIAVGIGYYRAKSNAEFRMVGFPAELSKDVIATVSGYERRESDGETLKYYIKADTATTFSDNHQELQNVYLQVFGEGGAADEITAQKAVYIPEENKNFRGYFAGNVVISSRDKLRLRTEQVTYSRSTDVATAEEDVDFDRFNVQGHSSGASLNLGRRLLQLNRNVQFEVNGENGNYSKLIAGKALYDQGTEQIEMLDGAALEKREPAANSRFVDSRLKAARVIAHLVEPSKGVRALGDVEFYDNVDVERNDNGATVSIQAKSGKYSRNADRFELHHDVSAKITRADTVYDARSAQAAYEPKNYRVELTGDSRIQKGNDFVSGQSLVAYLNAEYSVNKVDVTGNAQLRQATSEFVTDIASPKLVGLFNDDRVLSRADASGGAEISRVATDPADKTKLTINAATAMHSVFRSAGAVESMQTEGRTTIRLDVPDNGSDSANRSVTADSVKTVFQPDGKNIQSAEAVGNAEFISAPHRASAENYGLRTNAPRFDCEFYSGRNDPKTCVAANGTKTIRTPTVQYERRGEQTIASTRLVVMFDDRSRNISRLDAIGKAKFTELDRTAIADAFGFSSDNEVVQLRGGEPTAWDSKVRIKAKEIDWDTKNERSVYRKSVSSTYYNVQSAGNATPFADQSKPFYVTAENAELDHRGEIGVFTGNARGWQGNNYVRGERIELRKRESQMNAVGGVQSLLYDVKKNRLTSSATAVPVFAAAAEMHYDGNARTIKYDRSVDIRQGTDRITGSAALIRLNEQNEMTQTNVDSDVTITQSGRKAFADAMVYTVLDDRLFLRGRPARVEDVERGSSQGEELVIYLNDNRMSGEGRSKTNPSGRVRNIYKVK